VTSVKAPEDGRFGLRIAFQADRFGQLMQSRLLVFRPGSAVAGGGYFLPAVERKGPIELRAEAGHDTVRVRLPDGFRIGRDAGSSAPGESLRQYQSSWKAEGNEVVFDQTLEIQSIIVAAEQYRGVREFFEQVYGAELAPVVLVRK